MKNEPRHYCRLCGAKRNQSEMHTYAKATYGKYTWECNQCGDSRYASRVKRTPMDSQGHSKMTFTIRGKEDR